MGERGGGGEERWEKGMAPPSSKIIIILYIYKSYCINIIIKNYTKLIKLLSQQRGGITWKGKGG